MMLKYFIPVLVIFILGYGFYKKVDIFDTFLLGVKEGIKCVYNLFPTVFGMVVAINLLTNSGIIMDICNILRPIFRGTLFPVEALPLGLLRPISGSSSLVILSSILKEYGPDSFIGRLASVMQGSTDTTIYIIGMYFGSIGIKKIRYSLVVGLLSDMVSMVMAVMVVSMLF